MDLRAVMQTTPSVREFTDEPVPDDVLNSILEVARFAPNGGNRQAWQVIVLKDPEIRTHIRKLYVLAWREYMAHVYAGLVAFAPLDRGRYTGPAIDLEQARSTPAPTPFVDHLDEVPVLLVVLVELAQLAVIDNGLDRQSIVGGASVYPFVHNVLLAARDVELGGVMTTALCRQEPAVKELLGIPDGFAVAALVALGRPKSSITKLKRKPVDSFTRVDRFDGPSFVVSEAELFRSGD
jgi:nitroreductase